MKNKTSKSFTEDYLTFIENLISKSITKVILTNDEGVEHEITEFIENSNGYLEYSVPSSMGNFSNVKIYANDVLIENYDTIWIGNGEGAQIYHQINLIERVD